MLKKQIKMTHILFFEVGGDALKQTLQVMQRVVHRGVLGSPRVVRRHKVIIASEHFEFHSAKKYL